MNTPITKRKVMAMPKHYKPVGFTPKYDEYRNLSRIVSAACDKFMASRGIPLYTINGVIRNMEDTK